MAVVVEAVRAAVEVAQVAMGCVVVSVSEKGSLPVAGSCGAKGTGGVVEVAVEVGRAVGAGAEALARGAGTSHC